MTTTQQVLSDEQIAHKLDTHVGEPNPSYPLVKSDWLHFARAIESATLKALGGQEPVHQFRKQHCADWYDGHPDHEDGGGPYETRTLYTLPPAQPAPVDEREAEIAELRAEVDAWRKQCDRLTHQVICCGVAASHPDATLTTRGAYAGKWNSAQAEEVRKLRAERGALAALQGAQAPQAAGWLPIETAPKDGQRLILWWGGKPVFAGWLDNSQCKHPWAGWQTPSLTPRPQGEPTHWQPLPPAPQATKGGEA